jgi:CcmD family protein
MFTSAPIAHKGRKERTFKKLLIFVFLCVVSFVVKIHALQPPATGQSEFVPVTSVPTADQLPAAPLLIAAYAFVWLAVLFYVWTIWRRLNKVETDMAALARRSTERSSPR